jgi:type IV secretion system protein TrbG
MDPRRLLILTCLGLTLSGCAVFRHADPDPTLAVAASPVLPLAATPEPRDPRPGSEGAPDAPEPGAGPSTVRPADGAVPYEAAAAPPVPSGASGRRAIAAANVEARAASRADAFVGGVQVFAWSPGRVYEVWAAPLRVTTLTLGAGETLVSKAAGDTVRWQIGETTSGEGATVRTHVLLKPLQRGLETNLVLTTNRRVYFLDLKSGGADGFNAAVAWDTGALDPPTPLPVETAAEVRISDPVATPEGALDARYRIEPQGRRARWTPVSVFNDGRRTFIAFDPDLQIDEAPALFVVAPDGETQMVNYRQSGGLFIVDRVFDRAELRLGDRRPQVVRIRRLQGAAR